MDRGSNAGNIQSCNHNGPKRGNLQKTKYFGSIKLQKLQVYFTHISKWAQQRQKGVRKEKLAWPICYGYNTAKSTSHIGYELNPRLDAVI